MVRQRVVETNEGIQNELTAEVFDRFAKTMRDKGWNNVDTFIKAGITQGEVLEIGPGPGYVGLEWLKQSQNASLTGLEISGSMIRIANENARQYGLDDRVRYVQGNGMLMPFDENSFDAVFSNGSMHEWEDPVKVFDEIGRVLKPNGIFCISDMRRNVSPVLKWMIYFSTKPKEIRPGFLSSLNAAYTLGELDDLLKRSSIKSYSIQKEFFGLCVKGSKG
ncbi:MAG: class I SAM-dependent methyltransferase [Clostridiales bacterium]|jgi:ubiquinone/menaquinone biosynthesis C-methylase UbiE|nr:class I SAM-dependent methyltransferase [Clostridiales bacterium]